MKIREKVDLADYCGFRIGGPADFFTKITNLVELKEALAFGEARGLPVFLFGAGSNLLFDDQGFRGLVLRMEERSLTISRDRRTILAGAGYELPELVRQLARDGLGGISFLGNIPGSVGGAVVGNAGCYGRSVADVLVGVVVYDPSTGEVQEQEPAFCRFGYRHSRFKEIVDSYIIAARFQVEEGECDLILAELDEESGQRRSKHPVEQACAGSFFKNSPAVSTWRLIADAGLREASEGAAALAPEHPNFLINRGGATCTEVRTLATRIRDKVYQASAITLETEVRYIAPNGPRPLLFT